MAKITLALSSGQVSAILTVIEFICATLAVILLPFFISKLTNYSRNTDQKINFRHNTRARLWIEIVAFLLAVWFTVCVTIVESGLQEESFQSSESQFSSKWLAMDDKISRDSSVTIEYKLRADRFSIHAARISNCLEGIKTISFVITSLPNCYPLKTTHSKQVFQRANFQITTSGPGASKDEPSSMFFPYSTSNFTMNNLSNEQCTKKNITIPSKVSSIPFNFVPGANWLLRFSSFGFPVNPWIMAQITHENVCRMFNPLSMNSSKIVSTTIRTCNSTNLDGEQFYNHTCLHSRLSKIQNGVQTIQFTDVGSVIRHSDGTGTACLNATVEYDILVTHSHLFPYNFRVVKGHCERVVAQLGAMAMVYSSSVEWTANKSNALSHMTQQQIFHAYIVSLVRNDFFYYDFLGRTSKESIPFSKTERRTVIEVGTAFWLLAFILTLCLLVILGSTIVFFVLPNKHRTFQSIADFFELLLIGRK